MFAAYLPQAALEISHTTKFHRPGQGACNAARVEAADDVNDEPYPPTGPTGPHLLQTPRTRKGRRTVLFLVLVTFVRAAGFAPSMSRICSERRVGEGRGSDTASLRALLAAN